MSDRVNAREARGLFSTDDIVGLGKRADALRKERHPDGIVTYIVDRNINYGNVCTSGCLFCAFYAPPSSSEGYVLDYEEIKEKIGETQQLDGIQILMQGGLHPTWKIGDYERLLKNIKRDFNIHIHAFSPPEIYHISRLSGLRIRDVIARLHDAGLDSIPGGGAEILVDRVRSEISPGKCTAGEWLEVMRTAHTLGLKTTATMMFGHIETVDDRIEHMMKVRDLQDATGGFTAFIPWPFQPSHTALEQRVEEKADGIDYLKTLAVSRIVLDNVPNLQASWVTQGAKVGQMALFFGANDFGSTMLEENVVRAAGVSFQLGEKDIRHLIADAGYRPRRRTQAYELLPDPVGV